MPQLNEIVEKARIFLKDDFDDNTMQVAGSIAKLAELAQQTKKYNNLNGEDAESRAVVWQWLEKCVESQDGNFDKLMKVLNSDLKKRTYVAGNALTVADVVLYFTVEPLVCEMTHQEKQTTFINIARWFSHIQSIDGILSSDSKKVVVLKNNVYSST